MEPSGRVDAVVVGGGIIGLSVAWEAAGRGLSVAVVDPQPGHGSTWAAAGMLAPVAEAHFGEEALAALNVAAVRAWPGFAARLEAASGECVHFRADGTLLVAGDPSDRAATDRVLAFHQATGLSAARLGASACRASEPLLSPAIAGGVDLPDDHQVDNRATVGALLAACRSAGVRLVTDEVDHVDVVDLVGHETDTGASAGGQQCADGGPVVDLVVVGEVDPTGDGRGGERLRGPPRARTGPSRRQARGLVEGEDPVGGRPVGGVHRHQQRPVGPEVHRHARRRLQPGGEPRPRVDGGHVEGGERLLPELGLGHRCQHAGGGPCGPVPRLRVDDGDGQPPAGRLPGHGQPDDPAAHHYRVDAPGRLHGAMLGPSDGPLTWSASTGRRTPPLARHPGPPCTLVRPRKGQRRPARVDPHLNWSDPMTTDVSSGDGESTGSSRPVPVRLGSGRRRVTRAPSSGLYDPRFEHDACGVALVADLEGRPSHALVLQAISALEHLAHRGATGSEEDSGDGAGILIQLPDAFYRELVDFPLPARGRYATGIAFLSRDADSAARARDLFGKLATEEGLDVLGWRDLPVVNETLGAIAEAARPSMHQVFVAPSEGTPLSSGDPALAVDRLAYVLRNRAEHEIDECYLASLSARTITYKGMLTSHQLAEFYPDLADERLVSGLALVHSRFSTNTFPSWPLAHPYRYMAHNGEINTLAGNRNWMRAREALCATDLIPGLERAFPIVTPRASDSASFDEVLELLHLGGRPIQHAVLMLSLIHISE